MNIKKKFKQLLDFLYYHTDRIYPKASYFLTCFLYTHGRYICPNDLHISENGNYEKMDYPTLLHKNSRQYRQYTKRNKQYSNGILLEKDAQNRYYYNIVTIIQQGLIAFQLYKLTNKDKYKDEFNRVCQWLLNNQERSTGIWYYHNHYFHVPTQNEFINPWGSAMAQGQALSLLSRAYLIDNDNSYLESMELAIQSLDISISAGGLKRSFNGNIFYEEYPTVSPSLTLNGFMFCLIGLWDYSILGKSQKADKLLKEGLKTLTNILPYYDDDYCSAYDLSYLSTSSKKIANRKYHILHIKLLQYIDNLYPQSTYKKYIKKWGKSIGFDIIV
ncbi:D-glucuronyl C5-epimerase family protein [[Clostridium] symbiosum]|uniref:D-glucuronyl C5-epimerase family protein n=1 Tax=Clostridium symbiosum TaxID=1512 RepID=UPI001D07781E|nr:D-glucuronyl C5-epimerase family protein [[Clostridium] symbiosum]MCB6607643.1 D-glucuronyl C5-epimerase family protein [[Clostridium] symbiosum]MCB6929320.1 D-glucuronyl C5-epimerase family protein [[Clostridium] symbiosum]